LVCIGIKGSVVALNRATGGQEWATSLKNADVVNFVLQDEAVLAACYGEIFCLDPFTGKIRCHNPLKGFGWGLATIATEHNSGIGNAPALAMPPMSGATAGPAGATAGVAGRPGL